MADEIATLAAAMHGRRHQTEVSMALHWLRGTVGLVGRCSPGLNRRDLRRGPAPAVGVGRDDPVGRGGRSRLVERFLTVVDLAYASTATGAGADHLVPTPMDRRTSRGCRPRRDSPGSPDSTGSRSSDPRHRIPQPSAIDKVTGFVGGRHRRVRDDRIGGWVDHPGDQPNR